MTPNDRIRKAFADIDGASLKSRLTKNNKTAQLNFRITKEGRESINRTADELGMSTSDYLVTLHEIAHRRLTEE